MFTRIRIAIGFAFIAILMTSITAVAKGGFSFITITGSNPKEELRSDDPALTEDFFAFADFYRNKTSAPADPGAGYEITRYYMEARGEIAFDRLHYYPEAALVYYDGIVNGSSEYDGGWYTARPEVKSVFENALAVRAMDEIQSSASTGQTQPRISFPPVYLVLIAALGMAVILLFTYRLRKSFTD